MPHVPVFEKVVWMKMHTYFTDLEVFVSPCLFDMIYPIIQVSMMARLQLNWLPSTTRKIPCWSTSGVTKGSGFPSRCLVSNAGSSLRILKYLIFIHPRCPMGLEYLPTWKAKIYGKCIGKYACPMEHLGTVIPKERGIELPQDSYINVHFELLIFSCMTLYGSNRNWQWCSPSPETWNCKCSSIPQMVQQNIQCCHGKFWGHLTVPDLFVGSFIIRANPLTLVPQPCTEGVYQTSPAEFMVDFRTPIDSHGKKCFFLRFLPDISELWKRISMRRLIIPSLKHPETNSIWFWKFDEHRQNTKISQEGKSSEPNSLLFRGKLAVTLVPRCDLYTFFLHSYGKKNDCRRESEPSLGASRRGMTQRAGNASWCWRPTSLPSAYAPVNGRQVENRFPIGKSTWRW